MNVQVIEKEGKPEYAVIPFSEYERLLEQAEDAADAQAFDQALLRDEETVPQQLVERLIQGEHPVRVWRQYRNMTQAQLAERVGKAQSYIAMIEKGERDPGLAVLTKIAQALMLDLEDLI